MWFLANICDRPLHSMSAQGRLYESITVFSAFVIDLEQCIVMQFLNQPDNMISLCAVLKEDLWEDHKAEYFAGVGWAEGEWKGAMTPSKFFSGGYSSCSFFPCFAAFVWGKRFSNFFFHPRILLLPRREPNLARGWGHGSGYGRGKRRNHFIRDCAFRWLEAVRVRARRFKVWNWGISRDQVYLFGRNH